LLQQRLTENAFFKLDPSVNTLILGHSRPECAFNDSLISNTKNLSLVAEPYFYTYIKLRKLIAVNPTIKIVLIEFTNINISEKNMHDWMFGTGNIPYLYPKYSVLMNLNEKKLLLTKRPVEFIKTVSLNLNSNFTFSLSRSKNLIQFKEMGGYRIKDGSYIDSLNKITDKKNYVSSDKVALFNLNYLNKIVSLCHSKKVRIFFLRSPVHPLYGIDQAKNNYDSILKTMYPQVQLIDFANYHLNGEDYFDFHHLNQKGAIKVSKSIDSVLRLLNKKPETELFINGRMNVFQ
jgi:hypothetical protein